MRSWKRQSTWADDHNRPPVSQSARLPVLMVSTRPSGKGGRLVLDASASASSSCARSSLPFKRMPLSRWTCRWQTSAASVCPSSAMHTPSADHVSTASGSIASAFSKANPASSYWPVARRDMPVLCGEAFKKERSRSVGGRIMPASLLTALAERRGKGAEAGGDSGARANPRPPSPLRLVPLLSLLFTRREDLFVRGRPASAALLRLGSSRSMMHIHCKEESTRRWSRVLRLQSDGTSRIGADAPGVLAAPQGLSFMLVIGC
mmetsp:Transcript_12103/g.26148  ORF Transcript_12103/g.26148 Transcript_12103/m.26148 type:complete len:262 (+) Transcript_12103:836-1621(+)